jgi:hypothetical protein
VVEERRRKKDRKKEERMELEGGREINKANVGKYSHWGNLKIFCAIFVAFLKFRIRLKHLKMFPCIDEFPLTMNSSFPNLYSVTT